MLTVLVFARICENDNGRLFGFFLFMNMFALFVDQIVLHLSILQYKNKTRAISQLLIELHVLSFLLKIWRTSRYSQAIEIILS